MDQTYKHCQLEDRNVSPDEVKGDRQEYLGKILARLP